MREHADKIIEKASHVDLRISLNFVSVDGDEGYNDYFEVMFNFLIHFLDRAEFGTPFRDFVRTQLRFWIGGWLQLMKNARVKFFGKKIVVNPQDVSAGASMNGIAKSFEESSTFTDNSPLGKMHDCQPLDLFTIRRACILFQRAENMDEFLCIFLMRLWNEALKNRLFNWETRMVLSRNWWTTFMSNINLLFRKKHSAITQKKNCDNGYVTFVSRKKP
jgi:hypothetical protein